MSVGSWIPRSVREMERTYSVESVWLELARDAEHCLTHRDEETSMDNELSELRTSLIAIPPMPDEQFSQMAELGDGEIGRERGLSAFFSHNTNTHVCRLNHAHIITPVANAADAFFRVRPDQLGNLGFLHRRAATGDDGGESDGESNESGSKGVREQQGERLAVNQQTRIWFAA